MNDGPNDRQWAPRIWEGMDFFAWLRLFARGKGRVGLRQAYIALILGGVTFTNTVFKWLQRSRYGSRLDALEIQQPPVFVLGHWRTGTSLLHELLTLDDRHVTPLTFHCFEPCHCIMSETLFREKLKFLLPGKRPMDNMPAGWEIPQEDEFALALLGQPSSYHDIAWPNEEGDSSALDLRCLSPRRVEEWKRTLLAFLKAVLYLDRRVEQRRLVLKSPPHTARIQTLLEMFPDAKFVYLKRNPYVVYRSTIKLWQSFAEKHGLQTPSRSDLIQQKVLREFPILIRRYEETKSLIPAGHLIELSYEEFTGDFVVGMERVYRGLALGGWENVKTKIEESAKQRAGYAPNKFEIDDDTRRVVDEHWGDLIRGWGY